MWTHFGIFGDNISSKKRLLKIWPQVALIVLQIPYKGFWKTQIFKTYPQF